MDGVGAIGAGGETDRPAGRERLNPLTDRLIMVARGAELGLFVTLHEPTSAMITAAREAGSIETGGKMRPRVQICTVEDLLQGKKPTLPPIYDIISAAASARRVKPHLPPPTPEEIRRSPQFKYPISGGKQAPVQAELPMEEPLLAAAQAKSVTRTRRRKA